MSLTVGVTVADAAVAEGLAGVELDDMVQQVSDAMWQPEYRRIEAIEQAIGVVIQTFDGQGNFQQTDNVKGSISGITPNRPGGGTYSDRIIRSGRSQGVRRIVGFGRGEGNFEPKTCLPVCSTDFDISNSLIRAPEAQVRNISNLVHVGPRLQY